MTTTKTTFRLVAEELSAAFEHNQIKSNAPDWLQGSDVMLAIHKAVDDRMPDDWVYESTASIAETLTGYDFDDADEAREHIHEIADGMVDVYNADRTAWLGSHLLNAYLCDEATKESGTADTDMFQRIGLGQYLALDRIGQELVNQIEAEADSRE